MKKSSYILMLSPIMSQLGIFNWEVLTLRNSLEKLVKQYLDLNSLDKFIPSIERCVEEKIDDQPNSAQSIQYDGSQSLYDPIPESGEVTNSIIAALAIAGVILLLAQQPNISQEHVKVKVRNGHADDISHTFII